MLRHIPARHRTRRGILSMELVLTFPILLILLFGLLVLSPVENGGAGRSKMAALGLERD